MAALLVHWSPRQHAAEGVRAKLDELRCWNAWNAFRRTPRSKIGRREIKARLAARAGKNGQANPFLISAEMATTGGQRLVLVVACSSSGRLSGAPIKKDTRWASNEVLVLENRHCLVHGRSTARSSRRPSRRA